MLEAMLNRALSRDEEAAAALSQLSGKIFMIDILNTDLTFFLIPTADGISIVRHTDDEPNVQIRARPGGFITMLFPRFDQGAMPRDIEIIGDIGLIQQFQAILHGFDPDWEEPFSRWFGDRLTHKWARVIDRLKKHIADSSGNFILDVGEYLQFEKKIVPDQAELEDFYHLVDALRSATDRLEKRLERLEQNQSGL